MLLLSNKIAQNSFNFIDTKESQLAYKDVMGNNIKSLTKVKTNHINCSPPPPSQPFHHGRLSGQSNTISPPEISADYSLSPSSPSCLETLSRIICSIAFPWPGVRVTDLYFPTFSTPPFLKAGVTFAFTQSSGTSLGHCDFSKVTDSNLMTTSASSLSTHECISSPMILQPMVRQAVSLQRMEVHGRADIHLQPMEEPHVGTGRCPKEAATPWEACTGWSRLLVGPVDGTHTGAVHEGL